jgi:peptidoglycan L-alanyl-D-glutamate endopeptidase CwlK
MTFALSDRSLARLDGVDKRLASVVKQAILLTAIDFGVTEGWRTFERQEELVRVGASQTMKSKHLIGQAVDLVAYINGRVSWELSVYDEIAAAVRAAALGIGLKIVWGGAWSVGDICGWHGSMEAAMQSYIDDRRSKGRRPFIDAPHFEMMDVPDA